MRAHLAAIVDSSDDAILSKTLDGTILSWNRGAVALYGYSAEEIVGQPVSRLVPKDRPSEVEDILARLRAGDGVDHFETLRVRKDGTLVPVSLTISPVRDARGIIVAASTIARDITDRRRVDELEAARDSALELSRLKSEFLAMMSHEIRTPMNGVIGMAGLLLDTELDPEQREYAETVCRSGEALLSIIGDILDFSKIEAGKLNVDSVDFDLRDVVEDVGALLAEQAQAKGLELATLVDPDVPTAVRGDPGLLRQILINLVGNAVKFTGAGEVVIHAGKAHETTEDVGVRVEVADTGIGISSEMRSALFEPFSQGDPSRTRAYGGTGLGLAISKRLVELMGGEIAVTSEPGVGTTFSFTLRLAKQADGTPTPPPADLTGLRVLIVDDNATSREILGHQVTSRGMGKTLVAGGPAALELLRSGTAQGEVYDVLLIDMDMPGMSGLVLAQAILDDPVLAAVPLILVRSTALRGSAPAARAAGCSALLTKPVRQSELFDAIATVIAANDVAASTARHAISEGKAPKAHIVLLAEDNAINQKVAAAMLTKLGYRADIVANGAEALEALSQKRYGAVLMDCMMPVMDGYAATTEIRRREKPTERVPIIAVTAAAMADDREHCLAAGMDDYITKPVKLEDLAAVLKQWIAPADGKGAATHSGERHAVVDADSPDPAAT